jgi:pyruvate/2-oxoglutarate dehydrogenase complex dihydrolipoamide dehydrogenase (E3) component
VEKSDSLGGMLKFSYKDEHKFDLANYTTFLKHQLSKHAVDVRLNTEASVSYIESEKPYAVICAVGADPIEPSFQDKELLPGLQATEAYMNPEKVIGDNIVVVGGGLVGCEVGIFLAGKGKKVTVIEMTDTYAPDANIIHRDSMLEAVESLKDNLEIQVNVRCEKITDKGIKVTKEGKEEVIPATCVIYALGMKPKQDLAMELQSAKGVQSFIAIGDCQRPFRVKGAVHGGYYAAMDII